MPSDPRRVAKIHRRLAPVWLALMIPAVAAYLVMGFEAFARSSLLVTVLLSLYAAYIGDRSAEQAAESRFPEDDDDA